MEATFNTSRAKVVAKSSDGKMLNSNGVRTEIVVNKMMTAIVILAASNTSISAVGNGTRMNRMQAIKPSGRIHSCHGDSRVIWLKYATRKVILDSPNEGQNRPFGERRRVLNPGETV